MPRIRSFAAISARTKVIPNMMIPNPMKVRGFGISPRNIDARRVAPIGSPRNAEDTTYAGTRVRR